MPHPENLYFIALIPPNELREKITAFKQDFANRFNSKKALKVFPHITLKAPFKFSTGMHGVLLKWFNDLHVLQKPFNIQLQNFGEFENKRSPVVFGTTNYYKRIAIIASLTSVFPDNVHPKIKTIAV